MSYKEKYKQYLGWGLTIFFSLSGVLLFYYILTNHRNLLNSIGTFFSVITPVIIGIVIAYLLSPAVNRIEGIIYKKHDYNVKQRRRVRVLVTFFVEILFILLIFGCISLILPQLISSITNITDNYNEYYNNFMKWLTGLEEKYPKASKQIEIFVDKYSVKINEYFNSKLIPKIQNMVLDLTTGIFSFIKAIFNFLIGILISFYLLFSKEKFAAQGKKICFAFFKKDTANAFIHNVRFADKTFNGFIVGKIVDSIIIGIICYICTIFLKTPYPILISVIIGVTNVIPFFGPFIGAIPCGILLLLVDPKACLYFLIMVFLLQQFDGNILGPRILGSSTGITGFWVIFAITLFGGLWGPTGMIVGVPLFAVIYTVISAMLKTKLNAKGLTSQTDAYTNMNFIDKDDKFVTIPKEDIVTITSAKNINNHLEYIKTNPISKKNVLGFKKKVKTDKKNKTNKED